MTHVSPTVPQPNDVAKSIDISTPIGEIAAVINGNIDDTNISGISGSKLANLTVALAKINGGVIAGILRTNSIGTVSVGVPYKFRVYRTAAQNTSLNANATVLFDTKSYDTGSNVDIVTNKGRFTAPVAGFYYFTAAISVATNGAKVIAAALYKNGAVASNGQTLYYTSAVGTASVVVSDLLSLAANDYVEASIYDNAVDTIQTGSAVTYFSGFLVSET